MKYAGLYASLLLGVLSSLGCPGCTTTQTRLQSDDDKDKDKAPEVKTVGTVTSVWGAQPVKVYGVGVVCNLPGTGSNPEPGELRRAALSDLKQRGVEDVEGFFASGNCAVVMVTAVLPPGVRKDERIDVEVELPPRDKSSGLRGGYLMECELKEYADANQLRGGQGPHTALRGKTLVRAEGPILTGLGDANDRERLRQGRVWGGGRCMVDRNFALLLNRENQDARTAKACADRINERFFGEFRGTMRGMAEAKTKTTVTLKVPEQYRYNWPRYLRVVRHIPLRESPAARAQYLLKAAEALHDPSQTVAAALKLEALGIEAAPELKKGLHDSHPLVRFCAAEALAYLGDPSCGEPLAEAVRAEPRFRAFGLTALASLDEAVCQVKLRELLESPSAETRYGAFRALRTMDEKSPAVAGEWLGESFSLHRVARDSAPLIHISTTRRAEIVLFGHEQQLLPPFSLQAGPEFVVTAAEGAEECIVSRISARNGTRREPCSLKVDDVVRKLATLGAGYADVVDLLVQAGKYQNVGCRVAIDAVPQAPSVYTLARAGAVDKARAEAKADPKAGAKADAKADESDEAVELPMTPNLFATPGGRRPAKAGEE
jgi:hypothetical protein